MFYSVISKFVSVSIFRRVSYILKSIKVLFSSGPLLLGILNQIIIASFTLRYWVSVEVHHIEKYDFYFVLCLRKSRCWPGNVLYCIFISHEPWWWNRNGKTFGKLRLFCCKRNINDYDIMCSKSSKFSSMLELCGVDKKSVHYPNCVRRILSEDVIRPR